MLTTVKIKTAKPQERSYKLADSGGLYLLVQPNGSKLWRYKFRINGVEGKRALGAFPEVSLADARGLHAEARLLVAQGTTPLAGTARQGDRTSARAVGTSQRNVLCHRVGLEYSDVGRPASVYGEAAQPRDRQ